MIIGVGIDVVDVARFTPSLAADAAAARAAVHRRRAAAAAGLAGGPVRGQGGARQGARRAGRPALARRRGAPRRRRPAAPAHAAAPWRPAERARRATYPPVAQPRRRHRLGGRGRWRTERARRAYDVGDGARRRAGAARRAARRHADAARGGRAGDGLRAACCGGSTARGCCCSSAAATTAATRCTPGRGSPRRGARVEALLLGRPGARGGPGRAAPRPAAGSSTTSPRPRRTWSSTASSASAAAAGCAARAAERRRRAARRRRWSSRSTCPAASTRRPARSPAPPCAPTSPSRSARSSRACSSTPAPAHAGVVELVDIGLDLPAGRPSRCCRPTTSRRCCRGRSRESDKYRRGVVGVAAGSDAVHRRGRPVRRRRGPRRCRDGALRRATTSRPRWCARALARGRRRRRAGCRPGRSGPAAVATRPTGWTARSATACRWSSTPTRSPPCAELAGTAERTAPAHPARRRAGPAGRRRPRRRRGPPAAPRPGRGRSDLDAVVLLKGSTTVVARPDGRVRVNPTGTAGAGHRRLRRRAGRARAARCWPAGSTRSTPGRSAPGCTAWPAGSPPTAARPVSAVRRARRPPGRAWQTDHGDPPVPADDPPQRHAQATGRPGGDPRQRRRAAGAGRPPR